MYNEKDLKILSGMFLWTLKNAKQEPGHKTNSTMHNGVDTFSYLSFAFVIILKLNLNCKVLCNPRL